MTSITVDKLKLRYGTLDILKGVSFSAEPGKILALLGASGSGKTTLLRAIAGLEEPFSGSITMEGIALFDAAQGINLAPEKRDLGLVFQSYALWPHKTVAENVAYPLVLRGVSKADMAERVDKALSGIGLGALGERYPHQLSGGQQQRVALARALVYAPKMILLDEPLSNLDAKLREEARIWLRHLINALGLTAICVTHDQVEAMALADRILLLNGGQIEQDGSPRDIYECPQSLFTAEFMGSNNRIEGRVIRIEGERVTLAAGGVELVGRACGALSVGASATGVIRAERIRAEPGQSSAPGAYNGSITEAMFLGDRQELLCRIGDLSLRVFDQQEHGIGPASIVIEEKAFWIFPDA